jgi:hypothetical protein
MNNLPNNGSIVILDDKYMEAKPLIKLLSKNNKSFSYYDADPENLPLEGIEKEATRLVFLDYNLIPGATGRPIDTIIRYLSSIIPKNNGPYFIFLWSQTESDVSQFKEDLKERLSDSNGKLKEDKKHLFPWEVQSLDKIDFFETKEGEDSYKFIEGKDQELERKLEQVTREVPMLEYFSHWENMILYKEQKLISDIAGLLKIGNIRREAPTKKIVELLAYLELEKSMGSQNNIGKINASYKCLNNFLKIYLNHGMEREIELTSAGLNHLGDSLPDGFEIQELNRWLNINYLANEQHMGKVIVDDNTFLAYNLVDEIEDEEQFKRAIDKYSDSETFYKEIMLEISPECDIAQNKRRYYKFIRGCVISKNLIEKILSDTFYENKFKFKKEDGKVVFKFNDTIFNALEFKHKSYQNSSVYLILDFSQITTIPVTDTTITEKEVLFSINSDMLSTIKNKLAAVIYKKGYQHL